MKRFLYVGIAAAVLFAGSAGTVGALDEEGITQTIKRLDEKYAGRAKYLQQTDAVLKGRIRLLQEICRGQERRIRELERQMKVVLRGERRSLLQVESERLKKKKLSRRERQVKRRQTQVETPDSKKVVGAGEAGDLKNVALSSNGAEATAADYGTYLGQAQIPSRVNDGNDETTWAGMHIPGWCQVKFDKTYEIVKVGVVAQYHTQTFHVEISTDGKTWRKVADSYTTPDDSPSGESEGKHLAEFALEGQPARFVRVVVTKTDAPRSHIYQAMIGELRAFTDRRPD